MKKIIQIIISILIFVSCTHSTKITEKELTKDTTSVNKDTLTSEKKAESKEDKNCNLPKFIDDPKLEKEKIIIWSEEGAEKLIYSKNELNKILKLFPVFNEDVLYRKPEETYWISGIWKEYLNEKGEKETISFGSEAGQDAFYLLYAYFLKKKNGESKYRNERKTLIKLFQAINGIYEGLAYGGTGFGHEHQRLLGDAEYSIHLLAGQKEYYTKKYDFNTQKKLFIESLKQYIVDEESQNVENEIDKVEAKVRAKEFEKRINIINKLTTNYFYLSQIQKFEFNNYNR